MKDQERGAFSRLLTKVWGHYDRVPTDDDLDICWHKLKKYSLHAVGAALDYHLGDPDRGRFYPKAADIIAPMRFIAERQRTKETAPQMQIESDKTKAEQEAERRRVAAAFKTLVSELANKIPSMTV